MCSNRSRAENTRNGDSARENKYEPKHACTYWWSTMKMQSKIRSMLANSDFFDKRREAN
jgi:hypothetical protein